MRNVILILAAILCAQAAALAAIQSEEVPLDSIKGEHWTLDFTFRTPQRVVMTNDDGTKTAYWYLLYVVTNNTGEAREFVPQATLFTDTGQLARDGLHPAVVAAARERYGLTSLKNSVEMMGSAEADGEAEKTDKAEKAEPTGMPRPSLRAGEDQAEQGIFVFPEIDPKMKSFKVFITGLSAEFVVREIPAATAEAKPTEAVLRKTMELDFKCPGFDPVRDVVTVYLAGQKWIWR